MARHEFSPEVVRQLLEQCHRRCCVCHRFCGVKIEIDHIDGAAHKDSGAIDNAIALCFDCHAEVHHYNVSHPKDRRFHPAELKAHRDQWLRLCRERPEMFVHAQPSPEAGTLERLLSELEFNRVLAGAAHVGAQFEMTQFRRAMADGTFGWVPEELKTAIQSAYLAIATANGIFDAFVQKTLTDNTAAAALKRAQLPIDEAIKVLQATL